MQEVSRTAIPVSLDFPGCRHDDRIKPRDIFEHVITALGRDQTPEAAFKQVFKPIPLPAYTTQNGSVKPTAAGVAYNAEQLGRKLQELYQCASQLPYVGALPLVNLDVNEYFGFDDKGNPRLQPTPFKISPNLRCDNQEEWNQKVDEFVRVAQGNGPNARYRIYITEGYKFESFCDTPQGRKIAGVKPNQLPAMGKLICVVRTN